MFKYNVKILHWIRSADGDDWVLMNRDIGFDSLEESLKCARKPFSDSPKDVINTEIYDQDNDLIFRKDFIEDSETDYTTLPGMEYYNREYK